MSRTSASVVSAEVPAFRGTFEATDAEVPALEALVEKVRAAAPNLKEGP